MYEDNNGRVILVCLVFNATVTYIVCQVCLRHETYPLASTACKAINPSNAEATLVQATRT